MSLYLFLLNGPPKSGKSTLAREAIKWFSRRQVTAHAEGFANPMRAFASSLLGMPYTSIAKDTPLELLNNTTPREMLIDLSEKYLRKLYDGDFFGRALLYRWNRVVLSSTPNVLVMEDSGFQEEIKSIPRANTCLIRIIRPSHNYDSDSRSYLPKPDRTLHNDSGLEEAYSKTRDMVDYAIIKWRIMV